MKKILLFSFLLIICSCQKKVITSKNTLELSNNIFLFEENVNLHSLIKNKDIIFKDQQLKTTILGDNQITLEYEKNKQKYAEIIHYTVIDKTPPLVWLNSSYSVTVGTTTPLDESIICADNADPKPNCIIEGNYDLNKIGTYFLKHIATDASGNKAEKNFTLHVIAKDANQTNPNQKITPLKDVIVKYKNENTMIGIDVSKYQGEIDWVKVKNAGVEFAMIRLGTQWYFDNDDYIIDPYFKANIEGAIANNIQVGIYFYSYATNEKEAIKQANFVIDNIKNYDITMPIAFDWEVFKHWNKLNLSLYNLRQISSAYQDTLKNKGYRPVQYGSKNYLNAFWNPVKYETWLAHYTSAKSDYAEQYIMWQLCSNGRVDGINGDVDIYVYYKS